MAIDRETGPRPRTEDDVIRMERARQLWDEALDPRGTTVDQYLRSRAFDERKPLTIFLKLLTLAGETLK
jgi:hypothetical protein